MKSRNPDQRKDKNRAQLILIGGLVIAVVIIAIALVIGGGIFSQFTNDDGGLSRFTSETSDQIQSAAQVSQQDLEYLNENSTLLQGAYPDEICGELVNSTDVQQFVSTQLGEGESVVDIEVEEDCGDDKSWVVGQRNPNYNLPSVNATDQTKNERDPVDVVFSIDNSGSMSGSKLSNTKQGAKAAIDDLNESDKVGLVNYTTRLGTCDDGSGGTVPCDDPSAGSYLYGGAEAKLGGAMNELTGSWPTDLKNEIDEFTADGGTDITTAVDTAKNVLDAGKRPDDATQHIVLMTDGKHTTPSNDFTNPKPGNYIDANEADYSDTFIHTVALADTSDINETLLKKLANKDGSYSSVRPEGTYVQSNDPDDATTIFKGVIENIEDISSSAQTSSTGEVDNIYDMRMNATDFKGNGTYRMRYENGSSGDVIWGMVVDNKFINPSFSSNGYEVDFKSDVYDGVSNPLDLNQTVTVDDSEGNLSEPENYVWLDLTGKGSKDRFDVGGLDETQTANDLSGYSDPDNYIEDAWDKVEEAANSGGVNIVLEHRGPNGANNPPYRRGEVNGTFSIEFEPEDGDFTDMGQISGGNFTDDCNAANATNLPTRCGLNDNNRSAVSTTQIKEVSLLVTVEGPDGVSERGITIPPEDEQYSFDLFGS